MGADLVEKLAAFCANGPIRRVELFGSRLLGTDRWDSDTDLMITYDHDGAPLGWDFVSFAENLRRQLELALGLAVDLVDRRAVERTANPIVRQSILGRSRVVYERSA
jgi:predicted nucleotidyltransferase